MLKTSYLKLLMLFLCILLHRQLSFAQTYHTDEKLYEVYSSILDKLKEDKKVVLVYDSLVNRDIRKFNFRHPEEHYLYANLADWAKEPSWSSFLNSIDVSKIVTNGFHFENKFRSKIKVKLFVPGKRAIRLKKRQERNEKIYGPLLLSPVIISDDGSKAIFTVNYSTSSASIYFAVLEHSEWVIYKAKQLWMR